METPPTPRPFEAPAGFQPAGRAPDPDDAASIADDSGTPNDRLRLHRQFRSNILPDARNVILSLPPQYAAEPKRHFPVLYMQDGQNLFDGQTSFVPGRTWRMQETADTLIESGEVEPLIMVGIYNTGERRIAEYTPTRDWKMGGGEAAAYGRLIVEELMPFVSRHYRVRPGREHTGLGGSSLGGLVSLYLGLEYPHIFGRLAVHSPSVWWNHRSILSLLRSARLPERARVWLDVGDSEGARTLDDANRLCQQMVKQGWQPEIDLAYQVSPGGTHDEASWANRVGPMLRFLFPRKDV